MPNSLTRSVSLKVGPIILETLFKHYFARVVHDGSKSNVPIRSEELLYDEAFNIAKDFMNITTRHTVEELQSFANIRTPSPPWVHVVRLIIPMASCDEAAVHLIKLFGGEDVMKRVVGGTKWWQVRGIRGLDAEWISAKKDWKEAKKRAKEKNGPVSSSQRKPAQGLGVHGANNLEDVPSSPSPESKGRENCESVPAYDSATYQPEMDDMRCILYSHGGGYYFGSVDQERYCIQRYARKIHGRVLAVNYRLAPQYPFPCAIQDVLAAYLFLIRPPEGAAHRPVRPESIVLAGGSAGGGLSLALLQVIRDLGLPAPAGAVLFSPWCDFTHSFPSVFANTDTDIIPVTGLSIHKPSPLWPSPSNDISNRVQNGLRKSIIDVLSRRPRGVPSTRPVDSENVVPKDLPTAEGPLNTGATASLPLPGVLDANPAVVVATADGQTIEVAQQIQLYAPNGLLKHPLVSPALSYLGGLPPLLIFAGDREVLRDEIIYTAHRAAHPERFPVRDETKEMYPAFKHIETHMRPTSVHLQVYDDVAHILPVVFPFTTPGKYSYRAMASFTKFVTKISEEPFSPTLSTPGMTPTTDQGFSIFSTSLTPRNEVPNVQDPPPRARSSLKSGISQAVTNIKRRSSRWSRSPVQNANLLAVPLSNVPASGASGQVTPGYLSDSSCDVAGPRFGGSSEKSPESDVPMAGEAKVYEANWTTSAPWGMIRERVSTHGVIRPLEPESELLAMQVPPELIGTISELAIRRYIKGQEVINKKFSRTIKRIEKQRLRNIDRSNANMTQHIAALRYYLDKERKGGGSDGAGSGGNAEAFITPPSWNMAWALDVDERPPPSSIVARRDTAEALKLARVADEVVLASESTLSANNLWSVMVGFLTATPEDNQKNRDNNNKNTNLDNEESESSHPVKVKSRSKSRAARVSGSVDIGVQRKKTRRLGSLLRRKRRSGSSRGSSE
ncbi:hypothetical protein B0F90DRAFT_1778139 [Multifurca ochricompacta]|uniref:Alpha/beta hydrolase fold-3 domain-containing protein n=1 Tax=Multifurca ochricompacta TaxID=376703 RepID=A0AAD4QF03_9AGAM|nr:hypothetical protein B0F90DRAFT_1778139 [Multifurca ochricompacta]